MKKHVLFAAAIASLAMISSCGSKEAEQSEMPKDTVAVADTAAKAEETPAPAAKDFFYYEKLAKNASIEGLTLSQNNNYSDSSSKAFAIGYNVTNAAEVGVDKINFMAGSVARLGNKSDILNKSLDEFKAFQEKMVEKGVKVTDFKEYSKNGETFYYCTFKGKSDMMGGNKNYNQLFAHFVKDDVYLDFTVTVLDKKADLAKAEEVLKKMADYIAQ